MTETTVSGFSTDRLGSTYIVVVGAAMLIVTFMMASLMLVRVQRIGFQNSADIHQARLYAESAIDLGLHHIRRNEATWRSVNFDFDAIYGDYPGIELRLVDPIDGDIIDSYSDPVIMLATGSVGSAIQKIRARLNLDAEGYDCLESALHSSSDIHLDDSVLNLSEALSYEDTLTLQISSVVNGSVSGANLPTIDASSQVSGMISVPGDAPKNTPAYSGVDPFTFYIDSGSTIDVNDLWLSDHSLNRIGNSAFDDGLNSWDAVDCIATLNGNYANITGRSNDRAGITQDVSSLIYADGTYQLRCGIYNHEKIECVGEVNLEIESTTGTQYFSTPTTVCKGSSWTQLSGRVAPQWTGQLLKATWRVSLRHQGVAESVAPDYSLLMPTLRDVTYPDGTYVIKNQLLSPRHNPFGSGAVNDSGIYVLDANQEEVYIENTRVLGTLVLLNSDSVTIRKSINMSSYIYNYPVLMAQTDLSIELGENDLDEQLIGVNFNPVDAGYIGSEDVLLDDVLDNRIDGLVYVHRDLKVLGPLESSGVWVVNEDVVLESATLTIEHRKLYFNEPPPGFVDHTDLKVLTGSFSRSFSQ